MIIIRIHGGLGNQMFEYVFYRYMQERYEDKYPGLIKADITWFDRNHKEHQGYELKKVFNIDLPIASYKEIAKVHEYYPKYYPWAGFRFLARKIAKFRNKHNKPSGEHIYDFGPSQYEKNDLFDNLDLTKDWYLEGVYCSDEYLSLLKEKADQLFKFPKYSAAMESYYKRVSETNSVAIHARRGDYVGTVFDIVGREYYETAVNYIKSKQNNVKFFVFSDNPDYVKETFTFLDDYELVHNEGKSSYADMQLISACKHMIICNSTFSYWGAVIGEKEDSIVIAPKQYKSDVNRALARKNWVLL